MISAVDSSGFSLNRLIAVAGGASTYSSWATGAGRATGADQPGAANQPEDRVELSGSSAATPRDGQELSEEEQAQVEELKQRDAEVRRHEQAHQSAGGQYAGSAQYSCEQGPDGKRYAVGGEVSIDASTVPGDPEATIQKMQQVQRAATAPADPSAQDRRIAAKAAAAEQKARQELQEQRSEQGREQGNATQTTATQNNATQTTDRQSESSGIGDNDAARPAADSASVLAQDGLRVGGESDRIESPAPGAEDSNQGSVGRLGQPASAYLSGMVVDDRQALDRGFSPQQIADSRAVQSYSATQSTQTIGNTLNLVA